MEIGYLSDPVRGYVDGLTKVQSATALRRFISRYKLVANDALEVAKRIKPEQFEEFRLGLIKERAKRSAGEEWQEKYGAILLPEIILRVAMIAEHFGAPWGCAYIRCREEGHIREVDGVAVWKGDSQ